MVGLYGSVRIPKLYIESGQASSLLEVSRDPRYLTGSIWVIVLDLLYYITEFYKDPTDDPASKT